MLRRMFFQLSIIAGAVAFALTLWLALIKHQMDFIQASLRAVAAGSAILFIALLLSGLISKLGGPTGEEQSPGDEP